MLQSQERIDRGDHVRCYFHSIFRQQGAWSYLSLGTRWIGSAAHFEMFASELRVSVKWEDPILSPIPPGLMNFAPPDGSGYWTRIGPRLRWLLCKFRGGAARQDPLTCLRAAFQCVANVPTSISFAFYRSVGSVHSLQDSPVLHSRFSVVELRGVFMGP